MTDAEELAITREIMSKHCGVNLGDVSVYPCNDDNTLYEAFDGSKQDLPVVATGRTIQEAVYNARKKLAAERAEAAKSEREKRLERTMREVAAEVDNMSLIDTTPIFKIRDMIRQALES